MEQWLARKGQNDLLNFGVHTFIYFLAETELSSTSIFTHFSGDPPKHMNPKFHVTQVIRAWFTLHRDTIGPIKLTTLLISVLWDGVHEVVFDIKNSNAPAPDTEQCTYIQYAYICTCIHVHVIVKMYLFAFITLSCMASNENRKHSWTLLWFISHIFHLSEHCSMGILWFWELHK